MSMMMFWRDECLRKVVHSMKTGVLSTKTPVSMTPCPGRPEYQNSCQDVPRLKHPGNDTLLLRNINYKETTIVGN